MLGMLLVSAGIGFAVNGFMHTKVLNFMLIGMSFSTVFSNMVTKKQLDSIMKTINPVIGFGLIVVILDLAAPLDYHLIFGAGLYTAIYIISRAIGKYSGAYFGASITHSPDTVKKVSWIYVASPTRASVCECSAQTAQAACGRYLKAERAYKKTEQKLYERGHIKKQYA